MYLNCNKPTNRCLDLLTINQINCSRHTYNPTHAVRRTLCLSSFLSLCLFLSTLARTDPSIPCSVRRCRFQSTSVSLLYAPLAVPPPLLSPVDYCCCRCPWSWLQHWLVLSKFVLSTCTLPASQYSKCSRHSYQRRDDGSTDGSLTPLFLQLERQKAGYQACPWCFVENGRRRGSGRESAASVGVIYLDQEGARARPRRGAAVGSNSWTFCWCRRRRDQLSVEKMLSTSEVEIL